MTLLLTPAGAPISFRFGRPIVEGHSGMDEDIEKVEPPRKARLKRKEHENEQSVWI